MQNTPRLRRQSKEYGERLAILYVTALLMMTPIDLISAWGPLHFLFVLEKKNLGIWNFLW